MRTRNRIRMVCDRNTFVPWFEEMETSNPLNFPGYEENSGKRGKRQDFQRELLLGREKFLVKNYVLVYVTPDF